MELSSAIGLANRQFGVVARSQLLDLGLSPWQIARLTKSGIFVRVRPGVLALVGANRTLEARCMEVQLWAGGRGFLSSWTAGRLAGLRRMPGVDIHYTVPPSFRRDQPDGVHLDRSFWFHPLRDRVTRADGLIVASGTRMLWGLAADLHPRRFALAAEDAWHRQICSPTELAAYLDAHRCRGKPGVRAVERWLERASGMRAPAESGFEQDVIEALERARLPPAHRQYPLTTGSGEVIHLDIAWPRLRLAIEPGASWFHGGDERQHRDQVRDLACASLGWQVIRLDERFRSDLDAAATSIARSFRRRERDLHPPNPAA